MRPNQNVWFFGIGNYYLIGFTLKIVEQFNYLQSWWRKWCLG